MNNKLIKTTLALVLGFLLFSLGNSSAYTQPSGDQMDTFGEGRFHKKGFSGISKWLNITGGVDVTEDGIVFSIDVSPNEAALEKLNNLTQTHTGDKLEKLINKYNQSNHLNITLFSLVEYEDLDNDGLDKNDTLVSTYSLNSTNLGDIVYSSNETFELYTISSTDGIFELVLEVNKSQSIGLGWKWSVAIENYPFESNSSSIAMLHELGGDFYKVKDKIKDHKRKIRNKNIPGDVAEKVEKHRNHSKVKNKGRIPLYLKWLKTVQVDGVTENITASSHANLFSISFSQGTSIIYDPSIGINDNDVFTFDSEVDSSIGEFSSTGASNSNASFPLIALIGIPFIAMATLFILRKRN